jgi:hypothetical protein
LKWKRRRPIEKQRKTGPLPPERPLH